MDYLPLVLVLVAFVLHALGERRACALTGRPRDPAARRRALCFYAALAAIVVALEPPVDSWSDQLFWVHMLQHLVLLVVAAPLIVLARPWMSIWRPLPLRLRRAVAGPAVRSRALAPARAVLGLLGLAPIAWLVFNVNLVLWHMPGPYDAALSAQSVHVLEHTTFLVFGIVFWAQVAGYPPARTRLSYGQRIAYLAGAAITNVGLSMFLAYSQHPLYGHYAALAHRPGGISALTDQQIGAGFMWTAGDLPLAIAIGLLAHRWLAAQAAPPAHAAPPAQAGTRLT